MKKEIRTRDVAELPLEDYTLDELIGELNKYKVQHPDQELLVQFTAEGGYEYSGPEYLTITYKSEETDEEYNARIEYINKKQEEKERREMGRLVAAKKLKPEQQEKLKMYLAKYHSLKD